MRKHHGTPVTRLLTFADASRVLGCRPRDISDAIYARLVDETRLVTIGNRRVIPFEYLPSLREVLAARGKVRAELVTAGTQQRGRR